MSLRNLIRKIYWRLPNKPRHWLSAITYRLRDSFKKPLVTVVVPFHNEEQFLIEALRSIQQQSYKNFECLVINDASTDSSRDLVQTFIAGDSRFRVFDHSENRGLATSRNTGLRNAKGPYITFLDADDCLFAHSLWDRVLSFGRFEDPELMGVYCHIMPVPGSWKPKLIDFYPNMVATGKRIDYLSSNADCPFPVHSPLIKTELVRRFGGFNESMLHGEEDWDLWIRILRHGYHFIGTGILGGIYRQKSGSMSRTKPAQHIREGMHMLENMFSRLPEDQMVPGTPFIYHEPMSFYHKKIVEAVRVIRYAALYYLGGDQTGFKETINRLEAGAEHYLKRNLPIDNIIKQAIVRFYCLNQKEFNTVTTQYAEDYTAIRNTVLKRLRAQPTSVQVSDSSTANVYVSGNKGFTVRRPPYEGKEENRYFAIDVDKIRSFKDLHAGERCFIVGNGPSINKTDLTLLKNEITFGVNGIFYKTQEMGFTPTYYVIEDFHVLRDNLEVIKNYKVRHKFFPSEYRPYIPASDDTSFYLMNRGFYEKSSPNFRIPRFSTNAADKIYCGQSVTHINFQLAYYMGFSEVYLVGVDFSYVIPKSAIVSGLTIESTEDDPNHFHPDYFGKGKKWHDPQLDQVRKCFEFADLVFKWDGRKIYNATIDGKLDVFERVDYASLFPLLKVERSCTDMGATNA